MEEAPASEWMREGDTDQEGTRETASQVQVDVSGKGKRSNKKIAAQLNDTRVDINSGASGEKCR